MVSVYINGIPTPSANLDQVCRNWPGLLLMMLSAFLSKEAFSSTVNIGPLWRQVVALDEEGLSSVGRSLHVVLGSVGSRAVVVLAVAVAEVVAAEGGVAGLGALRIFL